jgi:SAM-dependent methyltransferase
LLRTKYVADRVVLVDNNWAVNLYEKNSHLEIPFLKTMIPQAKRDVKGLCKILRRYDTQSGRRLLDFSCGIGRHSIELAKRGFRVVGYDPSEGFITFAKKRSKSLKREYKKNVQFILGRPLEASSILSNQKFDCAILMGNSFGFVDENFDVLMLKNIASVLHKGSLVILEVENRDWTLRNFQAFKFRQKERIQVNETWKLISETSTFGSKFSYFELDSKEKGLLRPILNLNIRLRLYSLHEIIRLLAVAGLSYEISYESIYDHSPVRHQNQDIVVVASRS